MLYLKYKTITTPFRYPFRTAHGLKTEQPALLVALSFSGITGFGEAPAIHYYGVDTQSMLAKLTEKKDLIERYAFTEPERFWHYCHHLFPNDSFLVCALDMAYWDLYAKFKKTSFRKLWKFDDGPEPLTDYTIGLDDPDKMLEKMKAQPWPIYKIKVSEPAHLDLLKTIRKESRSKIRIDANAGWTPEQAFQLLPELEKLQIELIEQPLATTEHDAMRDLKAISKIPLIADESCVSEEDVAGLADQFHGINIKLTKCGGITPALRMIQEARELGLQVMLGCMNETEIGTYPMVHMASQVDYVDLDGPLLLDVPEPAFFGYDAGKLFMKPHPAFGDRR